MTTVFSLLGGAGLQFLSDAGTPLNGGKLYTYLAGTTTPASTYRSKDGMTLNSNPIILTSVGRVPYEIWLDNAVNYKFRLFDANDVPISNGTWDDISGAISSYSLAESSGSSLIGFIQAGTGAVLRTVQSKLRDFVNVKDFGVTGDGTTDDAPNIKKAADSLTSGGILYFPAGTYMVSRINASVADCINLNYNGITLMGAGKGITTIKMIAGQETFTRVIGAQSKSNITISNLTIDGNKANQTVGFEQQHGILLENCPTSLIQNVESINTRGDNIYLFGDCRDSWVLNCSVKDGERVGVHAQTVKNCTIMGLHYNSSTGSCGIKSELDGSGPQLEGLTIIGSTFKSAGASISGIILGGFSASGKCTQVSISGCIFNGTLASAVVYIFTDYLSVSGCIVTGAKEGIVDVSYNDAYGYTGCKNISITNNVLQGLTGGTNTYGISAYNTTGLVIANNLIKDSAVAQGIRVIHSTKFDVNSNIILGNTITSAGISVGECVYGIVQGNTVEVSSSAAGYGLSNDTYPATKIKFINNTVNGVCGDAIDCRYATSGSFNIIGLDAPLCGTFIDGTFPRVPTTGVWGIQNIVYDKTPTSGSYIGSVCTQAGGAKSTTRANITAYTVNTWALWSTGTTVWKCTVAGTTDVAAPSIVGKVVGNTVVDGTVTWTMMSLTTAIFKDFGAIT